MNVELVVDGFKHVNKIKIILDRLMSLNSKRLLFSNSSLNIRSK